MLDLSGELNETDGFIFTDIISGFKIVSGNIARVQGKLASMGMNMEDVRILMSIPGID